MEGFPFRIWWIFRNEYNFFQFPQKFNC